MISLSETFTNCVGLHSLSIFYQYCYYIITLLLFATILYYIEVLQCVVFSKAKLRNVKKAIFSTTSQLLY